jgi:DNA-binding phage protein
VKSPIDAGEGLAAVARTLNVGRSTLYHTLEDYR